MTEIVLYLSGRPDPRLRALLAGKPLYKAPGVALPPSLSEDLHWETLPERSKTDEAELCAHLVEALSRVGDSETRALLSAYANDFFTYGYRPLAGMLLGIAQAVAAHGATKLRVLTAKVAGRGIPMIGFQTLESLRGSNDLLYGRFAALLPEAFPDLAVHFEPLRGDLWSRKGLRSPLLAMANGVLSLRLVTLAWRLSTKRPAPTESMSKGITQLYVARSVHQACFAQRLAAGEDATAVAILPRALRGSLSELRTLQRLVAGESTNAGLTLSDVFRAFAATRLDMARLAVFARHGLKAPQRCVGYIIPLDLADIASDARLSSISILYKNLLGSLLDRLRPARLVSFELTGRLAGLEAQAARARGIETNTVQTALIAGVPHPIFPHTDRFYADTAIAQRMIAKIGAVRAGEVVYVGPPYPLPSLISSRPNRPRKLTFFSQPYEFDSSRQLLKALCIWARAQPSKETRVSVRLHPSDRVENYAHEAARYKDVLDFEAKGDLSALLLASDLAITRTSSVAKAAIGAGCPLLICQLTPLDLYGERDFILTDPDLRYIARSVSEIGERLDDFEAIKASTRRLRERLYGEARLSDLKAALRPPTENIQAANAHLAALPLFRGD